MQIYLPVADLPINVLLLVGLGGGVGFLSGMFGVGGGFLMTPLLMFIGVPPAVAVASEANQVTAASVSGVIAHWRRGNVDFKMGAVLVAGGFFGSTSGAFLFKALRALGHLELMIALSYVTFLGIVGVLMVWESYGAIRHRQLGTVQKGQKFHERAFLRALPFRMRFRRSKLYVSALLPLGIGFFVGVLAAIMGVGGGFIMVPAMIYLLGMPTSVVVGTSLFQIIFVTANVTVLHAVNTQTVDAMLALLLMAGSVIGAQFGTRVGAKLHGEQLRMLLGGLVLAVCLRVAWTLVATPGDAFSLGGVAAH
jgi:uncharacterized protein